MTHIYIDVETIPDSRANVQDYFARDVGPPGNYKKADTIAAWERDEKPAAIDAAIRKLALDPWFAELITVCIAVDDGPVRKFYGAPENEIITDVFRFLEDQRTYENYEAGAVYVGHVVGYDLRVIKARSLVHGIPATVRLPYDAKPWSDKIFDTANFLGDKLISMDKLCLALGIDGKGDFSGKDVYDAYLRGEIDRIAEYCKGDVERTREIHKRLIAR